VIASFIGTTVFYAFANLQDNNILKSEDGLLYEQHLGWSFWSAFLGTCLLLVASLLGCVATRAAFTRGRSRGGGGAAGGGGKDGTTRLVKIQVNNK
jgi:hypothetical protein